MPESVQITDLLGAVREGDGDSLNRLFEVVYGELKRRAHHRIAASSATLDTTGLVHEAYIKLVSSTDPDWQDRAHFYRVAARAMRQIVIDRARGRLAGKRGGGARMLDLDQVEDLAPTPQTAAETLVALDEALSSLGRQDERLARVVELRFFVGLSVEETARVLEVSDRTVKRDWRLARAFLHQAISPGDSEATPGTDTPPRGA